MVLVLNKKFIHINKTWIPVKPGANRRLVLKTEATIGKLTEKF